MYTLYLKFDIHLYFISGQNNKTYGKKLVKMKTKLMR